MRSQKMKINDNFRASFASRILFVFALTLLFIFTALLVLENKELQKFVPSSPLRSIALICGYSVAILSANYLMAIRGNNLTNWQAELLISLNFIIFLASATLPWLLPIVTETKCEWWKPLCQIARTETPDNRYFGLLIIQAPIFLFTVYKVRSHFRSGVE